MVDHCTSSGLEKSNRERKKSHPLTGCNLNGHHQTLYCVFILSSDGSTETQLLSLCLFVSAGDCVLPDIIWQTWWVALLHPENQVHILNHSRAYQTELRAAQPGYTSYTVNEITALDHWLSAGCLSFRPKNGSIILYNRKKVKYRKDGYCWKKRKDGKTTREDHMKLKVQGMEVSSTLHYTELLPLQDTHTSTPQKPPGSHMTTTSVVFQLPLLLNFSDVSSYNNHSEHVAAT